MQPMRVLVSLAALLLAPASAADCTALKQNLLTSSGCPSDCVLGTCVLYSPSQADGCVFYNSTGPCLSDDTFVLPGATDACTMTYQCMDALFDSKSRLWFLSLVDSRRSATLATAPVTQVQKLTYPSNAATVQLAGGLGRTVRGDVKNVLLDDSFFETPDKTVSFYLSDLNLATFVESRDFSARKWTSVAFNNANLDKVPAGFSKLGLTYIELTKNFIKSINDSTPFAKVETLNLAYNDLTVFNVSLKGVATLNLTGNPLGVIPEAIFGMTALKTLSMRACNLTNVKLTEAQFVFLEQLQRFDADLSLTSCGSGYMAKNLANGVGSVCIPGTEEAQTSSSGGSSHTTVIVVVVVVGVVVVAAIAFFLMRRKRKPLNGTNTKSGTDTLTTDYTNLTDPDTSSGIWNDPDLMAVRIEYRDIEPIKLLSRGGFGEVWLGLYMNENVAIKRLLSDKKTMNDAMAFATEIKTMARLDHPKIVRFIGVAWTNALTIQAVTEFMDCGDLRALLDSNRASSLTWTNLKCQIAIDVADALVYLHTLNPKLIHRDLKSRNVLIDANTGAKLSDFGISRNRSVEETMTAGVGTARWIAPEVILGGHYTEFADIYSFGVVLSELDTNKAPYHDAVNTNGAKLADVTILQQVSAGKLQPSFLPTCPEPIVRLARACMSFDPAQRPSAIHISYELRKILKDEL